MGEGSSVRRRRECLSCKARFTSYERVEERPLYVMKKDGTRQPYDRQKLTSGILKSCEKRPVGIEEIEQIADDVEKYLYSEYGREVSTTNIGEIVMDKLQKIDKVSYVRFASVYRQFESVSDFVKEIKTLS
ncbi:MAG: transcriptional regulator NrdR [Candidatus Margulisiibacteriota bacterium]